MFEVPVFYASTEGQTRRIAERIADRLTARGLSSAAIDVAGAAAAMIDWRFVRGALLGASLHAGQHQKAALQFVKAHLRELNDRPSAFFSVSLAAASKHPKEVDAARGIAADFVLQTGWHPDTAICLAGRLAYTQYGFFKRQVMKRIARKEGGPTDTSRDHEYTDWAAVDRFANEFATRLQMPHAVAS
jgi:menaquinone-dependent protoporphyrinogen oxidase